MHAARASCINSLTYEPLGKDFIIWEIHAHFRFTCSKIYAIDRNMFTLGAGCTLLKLSWELNVLDIVNKFGNT